jgi:hypothetical protein
LFDEGTQQVLLFDIHPDWKVSRICYKWSDSHGRQVAIEEKENDRYKLSITRSMPQELRDALVATFLLRLWHDTAESKQAKRQCGLYRFFVAVTRTLSLANFSFQSLKA